MRPNFLQARRPAKPRYVITHKNLPTKLPLTSLWLFVITFKLWPQDGWVYVVVGFFYISWVLLCAVTVGQETRVDVFED